MTELGFNNLPRRAHRRPQTSDRVPHIQCDQIPSGDIVQRLLLRISQLSNVRERDSRMAMPGVKAFWIPDDNACGPKTAFIDDHEFCHLHETGTIHLTAPKQLRELLIDRGWAEQHIVAKAGIIADTLLLVYAPQDETEVEVVTWIVRQSLAFATGR